eukprot:TRINITY_DN54095_c0_g1_i1.p1 TRINITY_DN54095_c0_g1~~TRINITY_DN54095_c0_g1_i1.p1  ORF type:complete len:351 (+),score=53.96 TRINITY_DN54095_c0_g1_i1:23-1054(+)
MDCSTITVRRAPFFGSQIKLRSPIPSSRNKNISTITCAAAQEPMTVAITGATGFVGSRLAWKLSSYGHNVRVLTRDVQKAKSKISNPRTTFYGKGDWFDGIKGCTGVVNLAGEPISTRWTPQIKEEILNSRVNATRQVVEAISQLKDKERPGVLVSASAVGFYGVSSTLSFNEDSPSGSDYLASVCRAWEGEAKKLPSDVRLAILRIGVVLDEGGGALGRMLPVFRIFAGGPLGSGSQWMSWIHRDDLVSLIVEALQNNKYQGTFNATAPNPERMGGVCSTIGQILGRPSWLPVPEFALNALLGEGAMIVAEGQRVLPAKTLETGFKFQFENIDGAIRDILKS